MAPTEMKVVTTTDEFNKNPELKQSDLENLRDWVSKQSHLPNVPDDQLILFLHSCFYSLEKAKKTIEACYTICAHSPEVFANKDPLQPNLQTVWSILNFAVLPKLTPNGDKVIVTKFCDTDTTKFVHADVCKLLLMTFDIALREEGTVAGYHFVHDVAGLTFGHLAKLNINILKTYIVYVQEGLRLRMKSINMVNMSPVADKLISLMKPFMKKELMERLHFYSTDLTPMNSHIPKNILPKDYGGDAASMEELSGVLRNKMEESQEWFVETEKWKSDESKRKGKSSTAEAYGLEGSFKKLDID